MKKAILFSMLVYTLGLYAQNPSGETKFFDEYSADEFSWITESDTTNPVAVCTPKKDTVYYPQSGSMTSLMVEIWIQDTSLTSQPVSISYPYKASGWYFKSNGGYIRDTYVFVLPDNEFMALFRSRLTNQSGMK